MNKLLLVLFVVSSVFTQSTTAQTLMQPNISLAQARKVIDAVIAKCSEPDRVTMSVAVEEMLQADPHAGDARVTVQVRPRALELGEHRLRARQQLLAGGRQLGAARGPPQQLDAELGLEPPHLLGQGGLGDPQLLRRAREAAVARDRGEVLQPPQLHALSAPSSRRRGSAARR